MKPMLLSIGDRIPFTRIDTVHSRYDRTVNFSYQDTIVSVHSFARPQSVSSIHLSDIDLSSIIAFERTKNGTLIINDDRTLSIPTVSVYNGSFSASDSMQLLEAIDISALRQILEQEIENNPLTCTLPDAVVRAASELFDRALEQSFMHAWQLWKDQNVTDAVRAFRGLGRGSTPAGDDFLIGLLLGLRVREHTEGFDFSVIREQIKHAAMGQNLIVNTLLEQAYWGWADSDFRLLIQSLIENNNDLTGNVHAILQHGSSSGADSLLGFVAAWS